MDEPLALYQTFEETYPEEAVAYCQEHGYYIVEIEPVDGKHIYQILDTPLPRKQYIKQQIYEYEDYLRKTDWYVIRAQERGTVIPIEIAEKRSIAQSEIERLEEELKKPDVPVNEEEPAEEPIEEPIEEEISNEPINEGEE